MNPGSPIDELRDQLMNLSSADDEVAIAALAAAWPDEVAQLLREPISGDEDGKTPLMKALWEGRYRAAVAMINAGADTLAVDWNDRSVTWYQENRGAGEQALRLSDAIRLERSRQAFVSAIEQAKANLGQDEATGEKSPVRQGRGKRDL